MEVNVVPIQIQNYTSCSDDIVESIRIRALQKEEQREHWITISIMLIVLFSGLKLLDMCGGKDCSEYASSHPWTPFVWLTFYFLRQRLGYQRKQKIIKTLEKIHLPPRLRSASGRDCLYGRHVTYIVRHRGAYFFYVFRKQNQEYLPNYSVYELQENEIDLSQRKTLRSLFRLHFFWSNENRYSVALDTLYF